MVEKSGDALAFGFDSQLYINKKALEYIAQQYNEERGKFGSLKTVFERIIYLAQYGNDLSSALQPIIDELIDFFELDSKINIGKASQQTAKGLFTRITNSSYFALFDKSDESLVNDYEMMSDLANTEQRPAMRAAQLAVHAAGPTSSTVYSRREACWSMNDPVPAAQSPLVS